MSITRIINKTPIQNKFVNVYEIDQVDSDVIKNVLGSRFIGEGVYCMEMYVANEYVEQYLITPSFDKLYDDVPTHKEWDFKSENLKELSAYEIQMSNPAFMPLDTKQFLNLFDVIKGIKFTPIFMQFLLCKRIDDWRDDVISLYEDWRNGNDDAFTNKFLRGIQNKALNVLNRLSGFNTKRNNVEEMEIKILSQNYRFECRFIIFEKKYINNFEKEIRKELLKLNLFNEIQLKRVEDKKQLIKCIGLRSFQSKSVDYLISEQEIYSLLCDKYVPSEHTPINNATNIKSATESILKEVTKSNYIQKITSFLPIEQRKESNELDNETLEQLQYAFKRVKITSEKLNVKDIHQGSTLIKVKMEIPPEVMFSQIQRNLVNIQSAVGNDNLSIEIGEEPDSINIFIPRKNREVLYLKEILESDEYKKHCDESILPFILGETSSGELRFTCLSKLKHILVAGATGSGKSVFINLIIISLLLSVDPQELSMYLIDPKKVELNQYNGFPQVKKVITDMDEACDLVKSLCVEMDRRYEILGKAGVKNIASYNKKMEKKMPYIVVVIDEYADLMLTNSEVENHIVRMSVKARAAGIHLIIAIQKPLTDILTSVLKSNLPSVIGFRMKSSTDYVTVFGKSIPYKLLGNGDGVAMLEGSVKEFERFQTPIMTLDENEEEEIYEKLKEMFEDIEVVDEDLPKEPEPIEKLKMIIADTGETRVTELGRLMKIGNNTVHDLIKTLVEEGWLEKQGNKYVIVVNDDELSQWRSA